MEVHGPLELKGSLDISSFCSTFPRKRAEAHIWRVTVTHQVSGTAHPGDQGCQTCSSHTYRAQARLRLSVITSPNLLPLPLLPRYCDTPTRAPGIVPGPDDDATGVAFGVDACVYLVLQSLLLSKITILS